MPDDDHSKSDDLNQDLVKVEPGSDLQEEDLVTSVARGLGAATRSLVDSFSMMGRILRPTSPDGPSSGSVEEHPETQSEQVQQQIEDLLRQLGDQLSRSTLGEEGYASLSEDETFWQLLDRLQQLRGRRLKKPKSRSLEVVPPPASSETGQEAASDAVSDAASETDQEAVSDEEHEDLLAGVFDGEANEDEEEGGDEDEGAGGDEGDEREERDERDEKDKKDKKDKKDT